MFRNMFSLYGRLTRDVELKTFERDGEPSYVASISIAVNRPKRANQEQEADFFYLTAFGKNAKNIAEYFSKGDRIGVSGRIQLDKYTDKDGVNRSTHRFVVDDFEFIETKKERERRAQSEYAEQAVVQPQASYGSGMSEPVGNGDMLDEDDLPF